MQCSIINLHNEPQVHVRDIIDLSILMVVWGTWQVGRGVRGVEGVWEWVGGAVFPPGGII